MEPNWLLLFLLMSTLGLAVVSDIRERRIPNPLIAAPLFLALAGNALADATPVWRDFGPGIALSLAGAATALACLLPFYLLRALGAGDVKLMAVVGAFLGPWQVLGAIVLSFIAGGVLALGAALLSHSTGQVFANLRLMLLVVMQPRGSGIAFSDVQTTGRLPYALAIAAGTLLQLALAAHGGWPFV